MKPVFRLAVLLFAASTPLAAQPLAGSRPNILFLLSDDQGYGDFSANGNPVLRTPNLDRVAHDGVQFSDFHVSPTCSPSRSTFLSGRHEFKNGVTHTIDERERLSLDATTIAQVLKGAGYATGIFGKWHLGDEDAYQPGRRGFDEVYIHGGGGIGQTFPGSCGDAPGNHYLNPTLLHNGRFERTAGYCTDLFFTHAMDWIGSLPAGRPFFCYLATNVPHMPLEVPPGYQGRYEGRAPGNAAPFFDMLANLDDNVGRLTAWLHARGLDRNTLLVVMNDNGGTFGVPVWNAGMRGHKNTPWEGGTRAASFWRWPGRIQPGVVGDLAEGVDLFPTFAALAGAPIAPTVEADLDGRSLAPLLENPSAPWADRLMFTHIGRWSRGRAAQSEYAGCRVRNQRYSLVCAAPDGAKRWQLFDLTSDYGEEHDIAAQHPDVVRTMDRAYDRWWRAVQPRLVNENRTGPSVNPFKARYWQQFGGGPSAEDLQLMDPHRTIGGGRGA